MRAYKYIRNNIYNIIRIGKWIGIIAIIVLIFKQGVKYRIMKVLCSNRGLRSTKPEVRVYNILKTPTKRTWVTQKLRNFGVSPGYWRQSEWVSQSLEDQNIIRYEFLNKKEISQRTFYVIIYDTYMYNNIYKTERGSQFGEGDKSLIEKMYTISRETQKQKESVYINGSESPDSTIQAGLWDVQPKEWERKIERGIMPLYIKDPIDNSYKEVSIRKDIQDNQVRSYIVECKYSENGRWTIWRKSSSRVQRVIANYICNRNRKKK